MSADRPDHPRPDARDGLPLVLAVCAALVALSAAWKGVCVDGSRNFRTTCYSDVLHLFTSRGLAEGGFPYVGGRLVDGAPVGTFEYPVLTGLFIWATSLLADTRTGFLLVSAVALLPAALLTAWQLHRMAGHRALLWAAAPALVLYALHNWDLLAVAAATSGIWAWARGRNLGAAVLFGMGACLKVYPGLFLVPLAVDRLVARDRAGALAVLGTGGLTVVGINLPFVLADADGWATTYVFQAARAADNTSGSVWYWVYDGLSTEQLNRLVPVLVLAGLAAAVTHGLVRARREGAFPLVQVCGAVLVAFLVVNKVTSPQYTLWVLPFLALLHVRWGWWAALAVTDLLHYVGVFRWYAALVSGDDPTLPERLLVVGVWTRSALLLLLFPLLLTARSAFTAPRGVEPVDRPGVPA